MTTQDYLKILRNQAGTYSYSSFASFAADFTGNAAGERRYQTFTQTFGNPVLDFTTNDYGFYAQDQFRATSKLMLNFGLRYEYTSIPQPEQVNADYPQTGRIHEPTKNFAPRFSMSYAFGDKTVVRGGFGMFYARYQGSLIQTLNFSNGLYQPSILVTPTTAGAPVFPRTLSSLEGFPTGNVSLASPHPISGTRTHCRET